TLHAALPTSPPPAPGRGAPRRRHAARRARALGRGAAAGPLRRVDRARSPAGPARLRASRAVRAPRARRWSPRPGQRRRGGADPARLAHAWTARPQAHRGRPAADRPGPGPRPPDQGLPRRARRAHSETVMSKRSTSSPPTLEPCSAPFPYVDYVRARQTLLDRLAGPPFYALLLGASGMGKSALLREVVGGLDRHRHHPIYLSSTRASMTNILRFLARMLRVPARRSSLETIDELAKAVRAQ